MWLFMNKTYWVRVLLIDFLTALILSAVACYILNLLNLKEVLVIGNIFGLYFLDVIAIEILVQSGNLSNNYKRFILAIILTIVFDIVFVLVMKLLFKFDILVSSNILNLNLHGLSVGLPLNSIIYLIIFALIMLIFNYLLYRKDKSKI